VVLLPAGRAVLNKIESTTDYKPKFIVKQKGKGMGDVCFVSKMARDTSPRPLFHEIS
jgi:hypothetical protein